MHAKPIIAAILQVIAIWLLIDVIEPFFPKIGHPWHVRWTIYLFVKICGAIAIFYCAGRLAGWLLKETPNISTGLIQPIDWFSVCCGVFGIWLIVEPFSRVCENIFQWLNALNEEGTVAQILDQLKFNAIHLAIALAVLFGRKAIGGLGQKPVA